MEHQNLATESIISIARLTNNGIDDNLLQALNDGVVWVKSFGEFDPDPLYPNTNNL